MIKTGIQWLPEIKDSWEVTKIKRLFNLAKEKANNENPTVLSLARSGIKVRNIDNNEGQLAASYTDYNPVQKGDLLLNSMDLYSGANCNVSEVEGVISPAYSNLRAKIALNPYYFDYYFKLQYWTMAMFAHGKGVSFDNRWTLNADALMNYEVPLPPLSEQNKIVERLKIKLDQVEKLIELHEQQIELVKEYKQAIITKIVTRGISNEYPLKNSGISYIGEIPQNWITNKLVKISEVISKGSTPKDLTMYQDSTHPYLFLRGENIQNSKISLDSTTFISEEDFNAMKRSILTKDDLLVVIAGSIGKVALVEEDILPCNLNQAISFVRIRDELIKKYVFYYLQSNVMKTMMQLKTVQATMTNLSMEDLGQLYVSMPKDRLEIENVLKKLNYAIEKTDSLIDVKRQKIRKLNEYKSSLVYEYVTGKKEVS